MVRDMMLGLVALAMASCGKNSTSNWVVDEDLNIRSDLPGLDHGPARPVEVMLGPEGKRLEFVRNEVIFIRKASRPSVDL